MTFDNWEHEEGALTRPSRRFAQSKLDEVVGCLASSGPPITIEQMDKASVDAASRRTPAYTLSPRTSLRLGSPDRRGGIVPELEGAQIPLS